METYIHYGHKHFDKNAFEDTKNTNRNKSTGGLWAGPTDAPYGSTTAAH